MQTYVTTTPALAAGVWWIQSRLGYRSRIEVNVFSNINHKPAYVLSHTINPHYKLKAGRIRKYESYEAEVELYDISVKDDEAFYVWGTPVHNCYRVGTTQSVMIYKLITKDTVDEKVDQIMFDKQGISGFIVDNIDIHSNPRLFDLLLSDTKKK